MSDSKLGSKVLELPQAVATEPPQAASPGTASILRRRDEKDTAVVVKLEPARLRELALLMTESLAARLGGEGYSPIPGSKPAPVRSKIPPLHPGMTVSEAFAHIAAACVTHMLANEAAVFSGSDPEGVHQMRVAVRRLRALVPVFAGTLEDSARAYLRSELGWVRRASGAARDWDVFIAETLEPMSGRMPADKGLVRLRSAALALRGNAYGAAHEALTSTRYTNLILILYRWIHDGAWFPVDGPSVRRSLSRPVEDLATRVLSRRAKRTLKLGKNLGDLEESDLHRLRISAKKLRYASEFCRSLYRPKRADRYRKLLVELQERLGTLNDVAVGSRLVTELREAEGRDTVDQAEFDRVKGLVDGWLAARADAALAGLAPCWSRFAKTKPFWA